MAWFGLIFRKIPLAFGRDRMKGGEKSEDDVAVILER